MGSSYAIVHMQKFKATALGGIQSHNRREHTPQTNPDIDAQRTGDNYDIVSCDDYCGEYRRKVSQLVASKRAPRKDAVATCGFVVTSDRETMDGLGADGQRAFFEDAARWFSARYGRDRVLYATVHMDETTPHMHIGIVPITADGHLSAKTMFGREELAAIQTDFAEEVGARYGLKRGEVGSERTHLSEMRYKAATAAQERDNAIMERDNAIRDAKALKGENEALKAENAELKGKIKALRGEINAAMTTKRRMDDIRDIKPEPVTSLLGGKEVAVKGVRVDDVEGLKQQALKAIALETRVHSLEKENARLNKLVPSIDDRRRQAAEQKELARYRDSLDRMPSIVRDAYFPKPEHQQTAAWREREDSL